ncbi:DUF1876 domain-containing protein [Nocardioides mesophilus]|uniref:DUF1876 domain-containing protein n=2 Tax=Nocardioides mesophilus TaxID=433659 RepID=A0A7G9RHK6_9ACTN|nr:DUF1876 domain-containing protein [Nocardioides mesophilus]
MHTAVKTWSVDLLIGERDGHTHADARLRTSDRTSLTATGVARLNPADRDIPEIGDELAAARALSELAHQLLHTAAQDIEAVTHERATLKD